MRNKWTWIAWMAVIFTLTATSPSIGMQANRVDCTTLTGKVMCGYQGWFTCEGDGSNRGWFHYGKRGEFKPGKCTIDLWPDVNELDCDEKYPTGFKHADGSTAFVFSSTNRETVLRHFQWMNEYGIDGVFVQRFATQTMNSNGLNHCNTVLEYCREGANQFGRAYALMYDLSGLRRNQIQHVIEDYKRVVDLLGISHDDNDKSYLRHNGKPVVAVWGIGFNDNRRYTLDECSKLVDFLKHDPQYGGCTVMVGVPTYWRTLTRDCVPDTLLHDIIKNADIVSPWTVGRYKTLSEIERHAQICLIPDIEWCRREGKEYLPVVFPGFSWHNMKPDSPLDFIPRLKGRFLWKQFVQARKAGAVMIYQAMFDEMDEGTAIFKCTNNPPVGESQFLTYEGLPSDHYLWLVGMGGKLLQEKIPLVDKFPKREADSPVLRVAAAQIPVTLDITKNVQTILNTIDKAIIEKADILLTPEGSLSGYTHEFDQSKVEQGLERILAKANEAGLALALGTCFVEIEDDRCYNQIRFYDEHGKYLGSHSKILLCGSMSKPSKGEINHYATSVLRTFKLKGISIGGLICNDMWGNPACTPMADTHLSQQLSDMGAKIVFHAINGGRDGGDWSEQVNWPFHESNLRMRAAAGKVWIVSADNCHPIDIPCSAPTGVLNPKGQWVVKSPKQGEHMVVYTIELD